MTPISLTDAQANLVELVHQLAPGEEVMLTEGNQPVARLSAVETPIPKRKRILGGMKGTVLYIADDFDAPLEAY